MGWRLGILTTHPVQYYAPWFRYLAQRMEIEVFYAHRQDAKGQAQAGFGVEFEWDIPLLEGYPYRWLNNVARNPRVGSFFGCDTPEIYRIIQKERFDAFLIFGWNYKSALQAVRACWAYEVPVLMRGDSQLRTPRSRIRRVLKYGPYRWFLPRVDAHLYVGQRNREYLLHYRVPEERLFFSPHFVDNDWFARRAREAEAVGHCRVIRQELGIPNKAFVLLYVGKLIPKKRPQDFVKACVTLMRIPAGSDVHAVLVGDGPLRKELEALAASWQERIHFAGFRNQSELPAIYAAADGLVLPGRETWGLVVNEAMACGLPCVVSDVAGCAPDLVDEGYTGYTFPIGDIGMLVQKVLELKERWRLQGQEIKTALARKVQIYSMERATQGLEEALGYVVQCRSGMRCPVSLRP